MYVLNRTDDAGRARADCGSLCYLQVINWRDRSDTVISDFGFIKRGYVAGIW